MAARRPPRRRPYNPYAYGTPQYFAQREKNLGRRLRAQALSARRSGSRKAERGARQTGRTIEKVRATARFSETVDRSATPRHVHHMIRSFDRLPAAERQKIADMLAQYGSQPVPGGTDFGLSRMGWWLFIQAGGATQ